MTAEKGVAGVSKFLIIVKKYSPYILGYFFIFLLVFSIFNSFEKTMENIDLEGKNIKLKMELKEVKTALAEIKKTNNEQNASIFDQCFVKKVESCLKCLNGAKK